MKPQLSTGQTKALQHASGDIARMVLTPEVEEEIYDLWCPCQLMAKHRFTINKCKLYSSSGSTSCQTCHYCPPLEKTVDPLAIFVRSARPYYTYEQIKQREVMSMAKTGVCEKCGEERTIVAKGMCTGCNYGTNADLTKEQVHAKKAVKTEKRAYRRIATFRPECGEKVPIHTNDGKEPGGIQINLKTNEDNQLFNRILERARRNRRGTGEELLALAEMALDTGMGTEKVEIGKLRKIVERMKTYPIPNGNPKDVFAEAFNMMLIRLDEMDGK